MKPGLRFPASRSSHHFTSSQGSSLHNSRGRHCVICLWHPLEPNSRLEAPVCLGSRGMCLGKGPRPSPWGLAGRGHSQDSFSPEALRQQTGCQGLASHSPPAVGAGPEGRWGQPALGPAPGSQRARTPGTAAGRGWGSGEAWGLVGNIKLKCLRKPSQCGFMSPT